MSEIKIVNGTDTTASGGGYAQQAKNAQQYQQPKYELNTPRGTVIQGSQQARPSYAVEPPFTKDQTTTAPVRYEVANNTVFSINKGPGVIQQNQPKAKTNGELLEAWFESLDVGADGFRPVFGGDGLDAAEGRIHVRIGGLSLLFHRNGDKLTPDTENPSDDDVKDAVKDEIERRFLAAEERARQARAAAEAEAAKAAMEANSTTSVVSGGGISPSDHFGGTCSNGGRFGYGGGYLGPIHEDDLKPGSGFTNTTSGRATGLDGTPAPSGEDESLDDFIDRIEEGDAARDAALDTTTPAPAEKTKTTPKTNTTKNPLTQTIKIGDETIQVPHELVLEILEYRQLSTSKKDDARRAELQIKIQSALAELMAGVSMTPEQMTAAQAANPPTTAAEAVQRLGALEGVKNIEVQPRVDGAPWSVSFELDGAPGRRILDGTGTLTTKVGNVEQVVDGETGDYTRRVDGKVTASSSKNDDGRYVLSVGGRTITLDADQTPVPDVQNDRFVITRSNADGKTVGVGWVDFDGDREVRIEQDPTTKRSTLVIDSASYDISEGERPAPGATDDQVVLVVDRKEEDGGGVQITGVINGDGRLHETIDGTDATLVRDTAGTGFEVILNPNVTKTGKLELPEHVLDPATARQLEQALEALRTHNRPLRAAMAGGGNEAPYGGDKAQVTKVAIRDGRLHVSMTIEPPGGAKMGSTWVIHPTQDGGARAYHLQPSGRPTRVDFDAGFASSKNLVLLDEGFSVTSTHERSGSDWTRTSNPGVSPAETDGVWMTIGKDIIGGLGTGAEVLFSPFQSALYGVVGTIQLATSAVGETKENGLQRASAIYTYRQATINKIPFLNGADASQKEDFMGAYYSVREVLDDEQWAFFNTFLDGKIDELRAKSDPVLADIMDRGAENNDEVRAYVAALHFGLAVVPASYFEKGGEAWDRGDTGAAIGNYAVGALTIAGQAYVEGLGFGLALSPLKAAAAMRAAGLTVEQFAALTKKLAQGVKVGGAEAKAAKVLAGISLLEAAVFLPPLLTGIGGIGAAYAKGDFKKATEQLLMTIAGLAGMIAGMRQGKKSFDRSLEARFGNPTVNVGPTATGGKVSANRPSPNERAETRQEYNRILDTDDVAAVAKTTGVDAGMVADVKAFVFDNPRLAIDADQASAWRRLANGEATAQDLVWFIHELNESSLVWFFEKSPNFRPELWDSVQRDAHFWTNRFAGWEHVIENGPLTTRATRALMTRLMRRTGELPDIFGPPTGPTPSAPTGAKAPRSHGFEGPPPTVDAPNQGAVGAAVEKAKTGAELNEAEVKVLLEQGVFESRQYLFRALSKFRRENGLPEIRSVEEALTVENCKDLCIDAQAALFQSLRNLGIDPGSIRVHQASKLIPGAHNHAFLTVRMPNGKAYVVDSTFRQFFNVADIRGVGRVGVETRLAKDGNIVADQLIRDGFIELTPDVANALGRGLSEGKKTDASPTDFLRDSTGELEFRLEDLIKLGDGYEMFRLPEGPATGGRAGSPAENALNQSQAKLSTVIAEMIAAALRDAPERHAVGRETRLADTLIQRLPGWEARDNATYGRHMARATAVLEGKIRSGEIRTFEAALDFLGSEVNRAARIMNRETAGSQSLDSFGAWRSGGDNSATGIGGPYAGYHARAQASRQGEFLRVLEQDGIPLTGISRDGFLGRMSSWWHTPPSSFTAILEKANGAWNRARTARTQAELVDAVAELQWWGFHMMPFSRGSAGAVDAMAKALLRAADVRPGRWKVGVGGDLEAFDTALKDYVDAYRSYFE